MTQGSFAWMATLLVWIVVPAVVVVTAWWRGRKSYERWQQTISASPSPQGYGGLHIVYSNPGESVRKISPPYDWNKEHAL
jgi:hypothetical protein